MMRSSINTAARAAPRSFGSTASGRLKRGGNSYRQFQGKRQLIQKWAQLERQCIVSALVQTMEQDRVNKSIGAVRSMSTTSGNSAPTSMSMETKTGNPHCTQLRSVSPHHNGSAVSSSQQQQKHQQLSTVALLGKPWEGEDLATPSQHPGKTKRTRELVSSRGLEIALSICRIIFISMARTPYNVWYYFAKAEEQMQESTTIEVDHYWTGTKILWADVRAARGLLANSLAGSTLSRRERKQIIRTVSDVVRMVPLSLFAVFPFKNSAIPVAMRHCPNLLPSTFKDSVKAEDDMKRQLESRIDMAHSFREGLEELVAEHKQKATSAKKDVKENAANLPNDETDLIANQERSATSMLFFLDKARHGGMMIPPDVIIRYARYFENDLALERMTRTQLKSMCKYMSVPCHGSDAFLRYKLRAMIRDLKVDDKRILWEGIDSLNEMELREACQERGMRSVGVSKDGYMRALQHWLALSVNRSVPVALLIMSRAYFLDEEIFETAAISRSRDGKCVAGLTEAISGLDKDTLNEVIKDLASRERKWSNVELLWRIQQAREECYTVGASRLSR